MRKQRRVGVEQHVQGCAATRRQTSRVVPCVWAPEPGILTRPSSCLSVRHLGDVTECHGLSELERPLGGLGGCRAVSVSLSLETSRGPGCVYYIHLCLWCSSSMPAGREVPRALLTSSAHPVEFPTTPVPEHCLLLIPDL